MWVNSDPKIDPNFALDMPTYKKTTTVYSFHPTVIHATYLYSDSDLDTQFQLCFDGTVTASTLTRLPLQTVLDTGCHKTLLSKKIYDQDIKHFQNYYEIPFLEKDSITVGNEQQIYAHKMIALPLKIQDHYFEFLGLVVDILDEYDFIIGLEATIQLEAVYYMTSHIVTYCQPVERGFPFNTIEVEFLDQSTCIHVSNKSNRPVYFYRDSPVTYFDLRWIGFFNPSQAVDMLTMKTPHTYVTSFAALQDASNHRLDNNLTPVMDTQDPYPWLELDDPRCFQTDRQILESAIDLSQFCRTSTQKVEFFDLLDKYKDAFCLRDKIGLAPHMQVYLDMTDNTQFFIRLFTVKEDMKSKVDREMDRLVKLGILKKGLSGYSSPAMAIPRKNSDIPRVVGNFRYLNKKFNTSI